MQVKTEILGEIVTKEQVADGVRFELTEGVNPRRFSRPLHSTALPSIRGSDLG